MNKTSLFENIQAINKNENFVAKTLDKLGYFDCRSNSPKNNAELSPRGIAFVVNPTGTGKTYQCIEVMKNLIKDNHAAKNNPNIRQKKLIFITFLKKNLPYQELYQSLMSELPEDLKKQNLQNDWVFVDSKIDAMLEHFEDGVVAGASIFNGMLNEKSESPIPFDSEILSGDLEKLREKIQSHNKNADILADIERLKNNCAIHINNLQSLITFELRKYIEESGISPDDLSSSDKAYEYLVKRFPWAVPLFPACQIREKSVVFMSVHKFLHNIPTLISKSKDPREFLSDFEVSLFIDEFDSAKAAMLDYCVEKSLRYPVDTPAFLKSFNQAKENFEKDKSKDSFLVGRYFQHKNADECRDEMFEVIDSLFNNTDASNQYKNRPTIIKNGKHFSYYKVAFSSNKALRDAMYKNQGFIFSHSTFFLSTGSNKEGKNIFLSYNEDDAICDLGFEKDLVKNKNKDSSYTAFPLAPALHTANSGYKELTGAIYLNLLNELAHRKNKFNDDLKEYSTKKENGDKQEGVDQGKEDEIPTEPTYSSVLNGYLSYIPAEFQDGLRNILSYYHTKYSGSTNRKNHTDHATKMRDVRRDTYSFYEKGEELVSLDDTNSGYDGRTKVYSTFINETPEVILCNWARHFLVLAVSATACIKTTLGNFDLRYVEDFCQTEDLTYYKTSEDDEQLLRDLLGLSTEFYSKKEGDGGVEIVITPREETARFELCKKKEERRSFVVKELKALLGEELVGGVSLVDNFLTDFLNEDRYHEILELMKIIQNYVYFEDNNIKAFLNLFSRTHSPNKKLIKYIAVALEKSKPERDIKVADIEKNIVVVSGVSAESTLELCKRNLSNGERRFVLSTYATMGAGVNIHYPIPDELVGKLKKSNRRPASKYMDFDAVYLNKPSFKIPTPKNVTKEMKSLIKYMYDILYCTMNLGFSDDLNTSRKNGSLLDSRAWRDLFIEAGMQSFIYSQANTSNKNTGSGDSSKQPYFPLPSLSILESVRNHIMLLLIQGVGRIARTNMKMPKIHVLYDKSLVKLWGDDTGVNLFIPEFDKLNKHVTSLLSEGGPEFKTSLISDFTDFFLNKSNKGTLTNDDISNWESLRELVLKYPVQKPTLAQAHEINPFLNEVLLGDYYICLEKTSASYYAATEKDHSRFHVYGIKRPELARNARKFSFDTTRMQNLFNNKVVSDYFRKNNYYTPSSFTQHWLNPVIWHGFYLGALGEAAGQALWAEHSKDKGWEPLSPMPAHQYEKFDFKAGENVYVDFKFWSEYTYVPADIARKKVLDKLISVGGGVALIINITVDEATRYNIQEHRYDNNTIIEIPYLMLSEKQGKDFVATERYAMILDRITRLFNEVEL